MEADPLDAILRQVARAPRGDEGALRIGDRIGRFELVRVIGRGGFGVVFEARDLELGRHVAVKTLRPGRDTQLFEAEAQAAARLNHPNVVTLFDFGTSSGAPYLVLELLRGETLADRLEKGPLTVEETVATAMQLARGLAHAHAAGVVHRDLKPANVLLVDDGRAKILDFGLASSQQGGTPAFMAPEQQRGEPMDRRADLYSLGVTLHVMLTGELPGAAAIEHAALAEIVAKLVAPAPADRMESCDVLIAALAAIERTLGPRDEAAQPFRYLEPFTERDASWFFGRDRDAGRLAQMIEARPLVAVVGPSGAGKTSLVAAGVFPRLRRRTPWTLIALRPGRDPFAALANACGGDAAALRAKPGLLGSVLRERGDRVLLFVDAFEELYALVADPAERNAFADAIAAAGDDVAASVRVVIAMREDFLSRHVEHPLLRDAIASNVFVVGAPDVDALVEVVTGPAERTGYSLEPGLPRELADALTAEAAPLPLLQLAASRLWEQRDRQARVVRRAALAELGGVPGVLATHADEVLRALAPEERAHVRAVFCALVTPDKTRARRERTELPGRPALIDRLLAGRLLTAVGDAVELAHESLITRWDTLRDWLDAERDTAALRHRLVDAAAHWRARGRARELLWRGKLLDEARTFDVLSLGPEARSFLEASRRAASRARRVRRVAMIAALVMAAVIAGGAVLFARNAERARVIEHQARRAATERADEATLAQARELASRDPMESLAALLRLSASFERWGAARTIAADALAHDVPVSIQFRGTLEGPMVFTPDGRELVVATSQGLRLWNIETHARRELAANEGAIGVLTISADGTLLATCSPDDGVTVRDVASGAVRWRVKTPPPCHALRFAADGKHVVATVGDGPPTPHGFDVATGIEQPIQGLPAPQAIRLAMAAPMPPEQRGFVIGRTDQLIGVRGQQLYTGHVGDQMRVIAAVPDAVYLSASGRGQAIVHDQHHVAHIYDLATGVVRDLERGTAISSFSPDGARVAFDHDGSTAITVMVPATDRRDTFTIDRAPLQSMTWSPDSRWLAVFGADWARVIDTQTGEVRPFAVASGVVGVTFTPDSKQLVVAGRDGRVRMWSLAEPTAKELYAYDGADLWYVAEDAQIGLARREGALELVDVAAGTRRVVPLAQGSVGWPQISRDRRWLVLAEDRERVHLYDLVANTDHILPGPGGLFAFSGDGARVAVTFPGAPTTIYDTATTSQVTTANLGDVGIMRFSHDGTRFAAADADGALRIVDVATGKARSISVHTRAIQDLRWSPDDTHIYTAAPDRALGAVDVQRGTFERYPRDRGCSNVGLSPDGTRLASCCGFGSLVVRTLATGEERSYGGEVGWCSDVRWAPDGQRLVTIESPDIVRVWDLASGESRALPERGTCCAVADWAPDSKSVLSWVGAATRNPDDLPSSPAELRAQIARVVADHRHDL